MININNITNFKILIRDSLGNEINIEDEKEKLAVSFLDNIVYFSLSTKYFNIGQYYKFQIAYMNQETVGYFSSIGVSKCLSKPNISIKDYFSNKENQFQQEFIGIYEDSEENIISEKPYSYCFNIYDNFNNLWETSGELIHNSIKDETNIYYDSYIPKSNIKENVVFYIEYEVKTINHLILKTPKYPIKIKKSVESENLKDIIFNTILDKDNGCVQLDILGDKKHTGFYLISRADSDSDFTIWQPLKKFYIFNNSFSEYFNSFSWRDFTLEHGKKYKYSIQQYNSINFLSDRVISNNIITADFEDIFLFDGEKQLKIQYNPKVDNFKNIVLESKVNTLGNKFPFIFRSGNTNYKEFSLSGLLSYLSDNNEYFISNQDLNLEEMNLEGNVPTTNLLDYNIAAEKVFKLKVLEWLNNGTPKLFRSATEGNYIVQLTNVSLTPVNELGRMLHNFSATASQIEDFSLSTLKNNKLLVLNEPNLFQFQLGSKLLTSALLNVDLNKNLWYGFQAIGMTPGAKLEITLLNDPFPQLIIIGATGSYNCDENIVISKIRIINEEAKNGVIFYKYKDQVLPPDFHNLKDIDNYTVLLQQFEDPQKSFSLLDDKINNIKNTVTKINTLRFYKKDIIKVKKLGNGKFIYLNIISDNIEEKLIANNPFIVFYDEDDNRYYDYTGNIIYNYNPSFSINQEEFYLDSIDFYICEDDILNILNSIENNEIIINNGVYVEIGYDLFIQHFSIEDKNELIIKKKNVFLERQENWLKNLSQENYKLLKTAYEEYINAIEGVVSSNDKLQSRFFI